MVSHTRLQYYNFNLCLVCLTGVFGCRWHRYKQSTDATKKRDLAFFAFLVLTMLYMMFFLYYWLITENYADWMNSYIYENVGSWHKYYSATFIITCVTFTYVLLVMVLALCHVGHGYEIYMHWLHKVILVLTVAACVAVTILMDSLWKHGWSLQTLSLRITGPFLHVAMVTVMTLLTWIIAGQWTKLYQKTTKIFCLLAYLLFMLSLYVAPVFIDSPCIVESSDLPRQTDVIAHRGASAMAPENTLIAFQLAANYTQFGFETDVGISYDGIPFLLHDGDLRRTTNVEELFPNRARDCACSFNISEIKQLDAGSWFVKRDPLNDISSAPSWARSRYPGEKIPTLAELLQFMKGSKRRLMFDIKLNSGPEHPHYKDYVDIVVKTILDSGIPQNQIWWLITDVTKFSSQAGAPNFTYVFPGGQHNISHLKAAGVHLINAEHSMLTLGDIQNYHKHNISTNIYLANTKWLYSLYWCAGVESVTSNFVHILTAMSSPVWHLSPVQFKVMWITTDALSVFIIIFIYLVQRIRHSNRTFHPESLTFEGARIRMNRVRHNRNMKEKLLRTADVLQEVDAAGAEEGIMGSCSAAPTPAVQQRFSHASTSSGGADGTNSLNSLNRFSGTSGISDALASLSSSNRYSGVSGLSSISGVVTIETNPDSRSYSDRDSRISQPSELPADIFT